MKKYTLPTLGVSVLVLINAFGIYKIDQYIHEMRHVQNVKSEKKKEIKITAHFKLGTSYSLIVPIMDQINGLEGVKNIKYISPEDALQNFKEKNKNNPDILKSMSEMNQSPLPPSIEIIFSLSDMAENAKNIVRILETNNLTSVIDYNDKYTQ